MIEIPLSPNGKNAGKYTAIVDDCDDWALNYIWGALINHNMVYASRYIHLGNGKGTSKSLHREVMEQALGRKLATREEIDHINGNALDNRRENLRIATRSQNAMNTRMYANNKTGFRGVRRTKNKYEASITSDGKRYPLGFFDTAEEAHEAYKAKAKELHGEFATNDTTAAPAPDFIPVHGINGFRIRQKVRLTTNLEIRAEDKLGFWSETFALSIGDIGIVSLVFPQSPDFVRVNFDTIHWVVETKNLEVVK